MNYPGMARVNKRQQTAGTAVNEFLESFLFDAVVESNI